MVMSVNSRPSAYALRPAVSPLRGRTAHSAGNRLQSDDHAPQKGDVERRKDRAVTDDIVPELRVDTAR